MIAPEINFDIKCVMCGTEVKSNDSEAFMHTYMYRLTGEEVIVKRCNGCKKKLIIPLNSKDKCYKLKITDKLFPMLH